MGVLKDFWGFEFMFGFVDKVVCFEDFRVVVKNFELLVYFILWFLLWYLCVVIVVGGGFVWIVLWFIILILWVVLCWMVVYLVIDVDLKVLGVMLCKLCICGIWFNINLLGEVVFGDCEVCV